MVQPEVTVGRVASGPLASGKSLGVTGATVRGSQTSVRSSDLPLWQVTVASHTADCYPQPRFIEPSRTANYAPPPSGMPIAAEPATFPFSLLLNRIRLTRVVSLQLTGRVDAPLTSLLIHRRIVAMSQKRRRILMLEHLEDRTVLTGVVTTSQDA